MPAITPELIETISVQAYDAIEAIREIDADVRLSELHYSIKTDTFYGRFQHHRGDLGMYIIKHNPLNDQYSFDADERGQFYTDDSEIVGGVNCREQIVIYKDTV